MASTSRAIIRLLTMRTRFHLNYRVCTIIKTNGNRWTSWRQISNLILITAARWHSTRGRRRAVRLAWCFRTQTTTADCTSGTTRKSAMPTNLTTCSRWTNFSLATVLTNHFLTALRLHWEEIIKTVWVELQSFVVQTEIRVRRIRLDSWTSTRKGRTCWDLRQTLKACQT